MPLRLETEDEMKLLSELRSGVLITEKTQLNRTDDVLDEHCFDRLDEFGIYAEEFLEPYERKLKDIEQIITVDERNQAIPEAVMQILKYKFLQCKKIYNRLLNAIHEVSPELLPIRNRLLRIRRQLIIIACKSSFKAEDILPFQQEIREVDSQRVDGKFMAEDGSIPPGQAVLVGLLDQNYAFAHDLVIATQPDFSPALQTLRERLVEIKQQLERLELTHKWTLRQTDLFSYQHQLHDIVKMRHDDDIDADPNQRGKFVDEKGQTPEGQTVLNFLLHKCYRMVLILLIESVPVSEALTPIYNQLTSVRQCLMAVKDIGAPCSPEELYPYQMKLASIDQLRKDGKFYDDRGHIPEGQALCVSTLEECYHILDELREEEDSKSETEAKSEAAATNNTL
ncbi:hypothetical protein DFQ30_007678 [Apophysomyces sp. BC1015]|nr:hypothetical protein DFQ30_007678 [Apophysomyces sp. BC1015]